jgi:manganese transport protein
LLILSQVVLSMQLPFAVIPLIRFTSNKSLMGAFMNRPVVRELAWITAAVIVGLNANLVYKTLGGWTEEAGDNAVWIWVTVVPLVAGLVFLLIHVSFASLFAARRRAQRAEPAPALELSTPTYRRIGVAIDFGPPDNKVLSHAGMLARSCDADLTLFHIVEGAIGQEFGKEAFGEEARQDAERLNAIARRLEEGGMKVTTALGFGRVPVALVRLARENNVDVLVMGGHGHRGLKDLVFGASISEVRHQLSIPVLVVQ